MAEAMKTPEIRDGKDPAALAAVRKAAEDSLDIRSGGDPVALSKAKIEGAVDWIAGMPVLKDVSEWSAAASGD
jgi:hypothetical protein